MALLSSHVLRTLAGLALGLASAVALLAQPSREYDLKAAFLYNFAAFVDWPPQAFHSDGAPFVIGVIGRDPFGPALDEIVRGERAKDRPLVVRRVHTVEQVRGCHILFVSASERHRVYEILRYARGHAILTVSDLPNFIAAGGMIELRTEAGRVVLHVDPNQVAAAELVVSSKLLRVARLAGGGGGVR